MYRVAAIAAVAWPLIFSPLVAGKSVLWVFVGLIIGWGPLPET
jgi:hypothetical protein